MNNFPSAIMGSTIVKALAVGVLAIVPAMAGSSNGLHFLAHRTAPLDHTEWQRFQNHAKGCGLSTDQQQRLLLASTLPGRPQRVSPLALSLSLSLACANRHAQ